MKSLFFILFTIISIQYSFAQTINDIPVDELKLTYIKIVATQDEGDIYLDLGTKYNAPRYNNRLANPDQRNVIKDENGHEIIFSSTTDALNFMHQLSFELVNTYPSVRDKATVNNFVLHRNH